jgi:hypothetical protein
MAILDEYFPNPPVDSGPVDDALALDTWLGLGDEGIHQNCPLTTTQSNTSESLTAPQQPSNTSPNVSGTPGLLNPDQAPETHDANNNLLSATIHTPLVKRVILDKSSHQLEDVIMALGEADDTSRTPDSYVPGVSEHLLAKSASTDYSKIMTGLAINCVRYNRRTARPALDVELERLREFERNKLERIAEDRQQMNMALPARITSEMNYQQYEERLRKTTENAIARLDVRELAERELQDTISEPTELTGEFREESDYENVIKQIEKENANDTRTRQRSLWKETYYWPMIQQRAKMIGPLPNPPGPKTEITPQEKIAAKRLMLAIGHGTSRDNIFKWMSYWKLLSDLRNRGATTLLLYRTNEFKTHFFRYTKKLDMLLSWNQVYDFPLHQLRLRVIAEEGNDFSGKCDIEDNRIFERLHIARTIAWGNDLSVWDQDQTEYENFLANHSIMATSGKSNKHVLCHGIKGKLDCNKSIFVNLVPYEGESGKRVIGNKPASTKLLAVSPLVSVAPRDFLGIFSRKLRYVDRKPSIAIRGPVPGLWLDHSEISGKLNQMKVAKPSEKTNVCLAWEGVNEVKGEKSFCQYWRVLVIATRDIMPFDQLIRPP